MVTPQGRTAEQIIARLAGRSHGVVTWTQLTRAGVTAAEIKHRARVGALIRVHRGVYRVGHRAPSTEADYLAAVLACGEGAVLSGLAAAHLLGVIRRAPRQPEVTTRGHRRVEGVRTKRTRGLDRRDTTRVRGIPATAVPRTLVDLAAALGVGDLARACHEAGVRYRTSPRDIDTALARQPNAKGAGKLRAIMHGDTPVLLSKLEAGFFKHLRDGNFPLPRTNRPAGGRRVDCRWPEYGLTVELNGYRFHNSRYSYEQDHRRGQEARARGDEFRTYTWGDVFEDPTFMLAELRELLGVARRRRRPLS